MKVNWNKETPTEEGWYWMKYKNKRKRYTICPACLIIVDNITIVHSAKNEVFMQGPNHGGEGLKYNGVLDPSIRFGPKIEEPDE